MQRTPKQNRSIHRLFSEYADILNECGASIPVILTNIPGIDWTPELVKELWRCFQKAKFGKARTRDLTTQEVSEVYDEVNRYFSGYGIHIPFPSYQELLISLGKFYE